MGQIFQSSAGSETDKASDNWDYLQERVAAAKNYFDPLLIDLSARVEEQIGRLKLQKTGVKQYLRELQDVALLFYSQREKIDRAAALIEAVRRDRELTREQLDKPQLPEVMKAGKRTPAKKKVDTLKVSLDLFNQDKAAEEIAAERGLTVQTIEKHLAHWVEHGEIDVNQLVEPDAQKEIAAALAQEETDFLKPVHERLDGRYAYAELKYTAAHMRRTKSNQQ